MLFPSVYFHTLVILRDAHTERQRQRLMVVYGDAWKLGEGGGVPIFKRHNAFQWTLTLPLTLTLGAGIPLVT